MKKLTAMLLTLVMVLALAVPASAATSMNNFNEKKDTYAGFTDVPADAWYGDSLKLCYESKLMQGFNSTTFKPLGNLTIAQAIVMAARLSSVYNGGTGTFERKSGEPWYQSALTYALEQKILTSADTGILNNLNSAATRAQMAYLFANALPDAELKAINVVTALPDVQESGTYGTQIFKLYRAGVLTGSGMYGTFSPNATITRQAACAIIARAAFPSQRKTLDLHEKFTEGATTFGMPVGTTKTVIEGGTQYESPDGNSAVIFSADTDNAYKGFSIATLSSDMVQQTLEESFAGTGLTASKMTTSLVKFGSIEAYRATFNATDGTIQMPCCAYLYVAGSTLAMYIALTAGGSSTLATMANSVTVNGSGVSVKLA